MSDACVGWDRCAAATAVCSREGVQERTAGRAEQRQSRGSGIRARTAGLCSEGLSKPLCCGASLNSARALSILGVSPHTFAPVFRPAGHQALRTAALPHLLRSIGRRRSGSLGNLWMPSNKSLAAAM